MIDCLSRLQKQQLTFFSRRITVWLRTILAGIVHVCGSPEVVRGTVVLICRRMRSPFHGRGRSVGLRGTVACDESSSYSLASTRPTAVLICGQQQSRIANVRPTTVQLRTKEPGTKCPATHRKETDTRYEADLLIHCGNCTVCHKTCYNWKRRPHSSCRLDSQCSGDREEEEAEEIKLLITVSIQRPRLSVLFIIPPKLIT